MAKQRKKANRPAPPVSKARGVKKKPARGAYSARVAPSGDTLILTPPRDAMDRTDDLEEARRMLDEGEAEIAVDELRWLIADCHHLLDAHWLLGQIAAEDDDWHLAAAHLGKAYEIGLAAVGPSPSLPLSHKEPANAAFYGAARGLMRALRELGEPKLAQEVRDTLLRLDPTVPVLLE